MAKPHDGAKTTQQRKSEMLDQVNRYLDNLQAQVSPLHIKTTMYLFLRFWDRTFSQVIINRDQLLKIKALIESR
jgi:glycerol-3-phosphate O-acyltransferase